MNHLRAGLAGIATAIWAALAASVAAQDAGNRSGPVVVELFTSQGCSSCPPADALLRELAARDDVLPLALHVDYWDYIGWADSFALHAHTERQRGYARAAGRDMVFTPQMIVMGQQSLVGARSMKLAELILRHMQSLPVISLTVVDEGAGPGVELRALGAPVAGPLDVLLVRYAPLRRVEITRGENAGRTLDYANVVEGWERLGQWDGVTALRLELEAPMDDLRAAVLVQRAGYGPILAAARVK